MTRGDLPSSSKWNASGAVPAGVALALGGGFARGFAHLGVLQVFEQHRIPINAIAGTSIGSILGAAYASGAPLAKIIAVCRNVRFRDFARWRFSRLGLASNHRLGDLIEQVLRARDFEDLLIPFAAVATDLGSGDAVVLRHGNLSQALRASCAFPGLFEPVHIGTRCLVDGGLVSPVPAREARALGATCVVGVSVDVHDGRAGDPTNLFQIVSRAVSAAQKNQSELWEKEANLILRPDVHSLAWDDFARAEEAIEAGAAAARSALPRIQQLLSRQMKSASQAQAFRQEQEARGNLWLAGALG
jgi:NTE family protein